MSYTLNPPYANVSITASNTSHTGYGAIPPITAGQVYTVAGSNGTTATPMWTTTATTHPYCAAELGDISGSGKLVLNGKNADIEINGKSLGDAIRAIEEALLIPGRLNRSTELEKEFDQLKALGDQYAKMEQKYRDQKRVWDILKTED